VANDPVVDHYSDALGEPRTVAPAVLRQVRAAFTPEPERSGPTRPGPLLVRPGAEVGSGTVTLEGGGTVEIRGRLDGDVPIGYHRLATDDGERALIVSPGRCHLPQGWRGWGWAAQLYAARSASSWGIGDLGDLARIGTWASSLGAAFVMINPLHAAAPGPDQESSPYSPTSRRMHNLAYLDIAAVAAAVGVDAAIVDDIAAVGRASNSERLIDRDRVVALKTNALERLWAALPPDRPPSTSTGRSGAASPDSMHDLTTWIALAERFGRDWTTWPARYRSPRSPDVVAFAAEHSDRIAFHRWVQGLLEAQLESASASTRVIQDMPIGFDPAGADAWTWQDLLAPGFHVGAPPDEFNAAGQDWGLPPFLPEALRRADYQPLIETLRSTMTSGGGLRIDHVMGLFRLWCIPEGNDPADGAYVRYPSDDLLDIVALESARRGALVIGEDLGTVEESVRDAMAARDMLSYRLLWFEDDEPERWPRRAMAAVTTHDLPTVAGLWTGSDIDEQRRLGLAANETSLHAIRERLRDRGGLDERATVDEAVMAAHRLLARAPSTLLCATLDDALAVPERPNVPGAALDRPNWCLALPETFESFSAGPLPLAIAAVLDEAVAGGRESDTG
jgi:4-alpha-glucanotransferase